MVEYLLNPAHPDNGGKARFFAMLGYTTDTAELLVDAMRAIAVTDEAARRLESVHGEIYVVDGRLPSHTGQRPGRLVRTVWIINHGRETPRLVTAYPRGE